MNFEFLNNIAAVELPVVEHKQKGKKATPKNPSSGLTIRIFKDGAVYPSQELVDKFNLEYENKGVDALINGFDVFSSKDWVQYPKEVQQAIFISAIPKSEAKVTLFGSVDYNEDGTPKKSVLNQGSKRPEIVEWLRDVYNKRVATYATNEAMTEFDTMDSLFLDKNYVDLEVNTEVKVFEGLPKYYIPKRFVKGEKAGQMSYVERTNLEIYPLVIAVNTVETEVVNQVEEVETV